MTGRTPAQAKPTQKRKSARQQLRDKVSPITKRELAEMEQNAARALDKLAKEYGGWVNAQLKDLDTLAKAEGEAAGQERADAAFTIAHDMKGQGGTFGFDTITVLAGMLSQDIRRSAVLTPPLVRKMILAYVDAIQSVLDHNLKSREDATFQAIEATLNAWRVKNFR
jgi:chemotaxis protein histidine kinase CheA